MTYGLSKNVLFIFQNSRYFPRCLSVADFRRDPFVAGKHFLCGFDPLQWTEPTFSGWTHASWNVPQAPGRNMPSAVLCAEASPSRPGRRAVARRCPPPPLAPPSPGAAPCTPPVTCHDPRPLPGRGRHRVTHASGRESARPSPVPSAETRHTSSCCGVSVLGSAPIGGPGQPGLTLGGPQSHLDGASFALMTRTPSLTAFKVSPLSPI